MTEPHRRQSSRPSTDQKRAREEMADARAAQLARKKRTRQLIQMGGVLAAHGFTTPEQVDELMATLASRDSWREWLSRRGVTLRKGPPKAL